MTFDLQDRLTDCTCKEMEKKTKTNTVTLHVDTSSSWVIYFSMLWHLRARRGHGWTWMMQFLYKLADYNLNVSKLLTQSYPGLQWLSLTADQLILNIMGGVLLLSANGRLFMDFFSNFVLNLRSSETLETGINQQLLQPSFWSRSCKRWFHQETDGCHCPFPVSLLFIFGITIRPYFNFSHIFCLF